MYLCFFLLIRRFTWDPIVNLTLFLSAYLVIAYGVIRKIGIHIVNKKFLDENVLILCATFGAFVINKYLEGVAVMLFFQVGMILEDLALGHSKRSIARRMNISPTYANLKTTEGERKVEPKELSLRDIVIIKPGERVPIDGVIIEGSTSIDTRAITGEAIPADVRVGDIVYSGSINLTGAIEVKVVRVYKESTASRVKELVEQAGEKKAQTERNAGKLAKTYTIVVAVCAVMLALIPPLVIEPGQWHKWIYRGLIFLVVACPCGMAVSVPVAFFGGIAAAAKHGIVVKGCNYLENLAKATTFVFDKTGTLTEGAFGVTDVEAFGMNVDRLLEITANVENYSNHPISQSLNQAYGKELHAERVKDTQEIPGYGIWAVYDGMEVCIGNERLMEARGADYIKKEVPGTMIHVLVDGAYAGFLTIEDMVKEDAKETIHYLSKRRHAAVVMLTGDNKIAGEDVAEKLGIENVYTNLLPEEKVAVVEEMMSLEDDTEALVFVGDGINDAPVLARADVGIAMGALGSDAAIEAADIILMDDEPSLIINAIKIARETIKVVRHNITISFVIKAILLLMCTLGYVTMWTAVLVDIGVMLLAVVNAVWVMNYPV